MTHQPVRPRIFVVTATFPPDGAVGGLRTLRLLKHLARTGSTLEVLTIAPETYRAGTVIDTGLLSHVPEGVRVIRAPALRPVQRLGAWVRRAFVGPAGAHAPTPGGAAAVTPARAPVVPLQRLRQACDALMALPDREASWIAPAIASGRAAARSGGRPDVIYSSGPPYSAHVVAACLAALFGRPWVADFRDPWARAPWREDRFRFEKRAWSIFERLVVRRANAVVFVTDANRNDFAAQYGEGIAQRFHVVPNGCDVADFDGLAPRRSHDPFVLLHAGSLYGARDPSPLFRAVAEAVSNGAIDPHRFRIRLIGRIGVPGVDLPGLIRALGLETVVEVVSQVPRRMVLQEMLDASALLIVQPITRVSVPAKLYEYLAAGRPILALAEPEGATAAVVAQSGAGLAVSPADPPGIRRALAQLIAAGTRSLHVDRSLYDGSLRAAELAAIVRRAAGNGTAGMASAAVPISTEPS
jgi:glycosyltransferase involved in cell wall biosynthesis